MCNDFSSKALNIGIKSATFLAFRILTDDEWSTVNGDLNAAIKESKKEEPDTSKVKSMFEGAIEAIKEVGDTIEKVSK